MRNLLVVLAAAVTSGLAVFFAFSGSMDAVGNNLLMRLDVFVGFVAVLAIAACAAALGFRALLIRSDDRQLRGLRERLARLEAASGLATPAPADPAAPPAPPAAPAARPGAAAR